MSRDAEPMRAAVALFLALALGGCGPLDQQAVVLALEPGWSAEVAASDADGFGSPDGLLWTDGWLYVADEGGSALRAWRPGMRATTLADASAGLASPEDLVRDAAGNIYFTDDSRGGLWRTDRLGRTTAVVAPGEGLKSSEGLALSPDGDLIVGDAPGHRVLKVSPAGKVSVLIGADSGIAKPESFAFDAHGNLYIADNHDKILYLRTADGRLHRLIADRAGFSPESLRFAGRALFITDSDHGKLLRYTPEDGLEVVALFGGRLANVQGIAADDRGHLYVSVQSDLLGRKGYILRLYRRTSRV
ncbi:MAG TPA: SMP-30/gluconolactonase/LRE family protein [Allosphingosinicella sp.]